MKLPTKFKKNLREKIQADRRLKSREKVVDFFLNLYNAQMKGLTNNPNLFKQLNEVHGRLFTYELGVKNFEKWSSRFMGITHLGETSGGKSKCFKVTYDDVLVVKIPRKPISSLPDYIEGIKTERQIAAKLAPEIKCIAPQVSPILKRIPAFYDGMGWVPEELEDKCMERLLQFPQFQEYLKIDGSFVYFMDISKYSFLIQIIKDMYDFRDKIQKEIIYSPDIILNFHKFEEKYGIQNASVWLNINQVFKEYESNVDNMLGRYGLASVVSSYRKRSWFLKFLTETEDLKDESGIGSEFLDELNVTIRDLVHRCRTHIQNFTQTVSDHTRQELFAKNSGRITGIVTSTLRLLANLKEKQVAIRDLKPDNIFVMMELARISINRTYENIVCLGLIDLETAISLDIKKTEPLKQPLLGGTPSYATPSNFVKNPVLESVFEETPKILHLQDWHSSLCIIYITITGESLFVRSRNILNEIINIMKMPESQRPDLKDKFQKNSYHFWYTATEEFQKKTIAKQALLKEIEIQIPANTRKMFYQEAVNWSQRINNIILKRLGNQPVFRTQNSIKKLKDSSCEILKKYRKRWEKEINVPQVAPEARLWIINFIKELEKLKSMRIQHDQWCEIFSKKNLYMNAFDIMEFMFQIVSQEMSLSLKKIQSSREAPFEITENKQRISVEDTL